jgi:hypothetical protein
MTDYHLSRIIKGYRALACCGNILYLYRNNSMYEYDLLTDKIKYLNKLPCEGSNYFKKYFSTSRLIGRVLRLHPTTSIIFKNFLYVAFNSIVYKLDLHTKECFIDFKVPENKKILNFSIVKGEEGEFLVFGEYFSNPKKGPANIWRKLEQSTNGWSILYTFPIGAINHIHNIFQIKDRVLVLTGDFGDASAIWSFDFTFSDCRLVGYGSQMYRATWISNFNNSFYYATDSQLEQNYLVCLSDRLGENCIQELCKLPGSSIYHGVSLDPSRLIFSTSVECDEPSGNAFADLFSLRRGPGITSNNSYIFEYDLDGDVLLDVFSLEKDYFPFRLFQFGSFIFPSGVMPKNTLIAYCNALKKYDNCTLIFKK